MKILWKKEYESLEQSRLNYLRAWEAAEALAQKRKEELLARERDFVAQQQILLDLANALERAENAEKYIEHLKDIAHLKWGESLEYFVINCTKNN